MEQNSKYYLIRNKYLAEAMSFLGFRFYKLNKNEPTTIYSFEKTPQFELALNKILELKKQYGLFE